MLFTLKAEDRCEYMAVVGVLMTITMGVGMIWRGLPCGSSPFSSRGEDDFADKMLSALRYQFGGHKEKADTKAGG